MAHSSWDTLYMCVCVRLLILSFCYFLCALVFHCPLRWQNNVDLLCSCHFQRGLLCIESMISSYVIILPTRRIKLLKNSDTSRCFWRDTGECYILEILHCTAFLKVYMNSQHALHSFLRNLNLPIIDQLQNVLMIKVCGSYVLLYFVILNFN
jgi:hypothetical protein